MTIPVEGSVNSRTLISLRFSQFYVQSAKIRTVNLKGLPRLRGHPFAIDKTFFDKERLVVQLEVMQSENVTLIAPHTAALTGGTVCFVCTRRQYEGGGILTEYRTLGLASWANTGRKILTIVMLLYPEKRSNS